MSAKLTVNIDSPCIEPDETLFSWEIKPLGLSGTIDLGVSPCIITLEPPEESGDCCMDYDEFFTDKDLLDLIEGEAWFYYFKIQQKKKRYYGS